jgi:hypothetical protein
MDVDVVALTGNGVLRTCMLWKPLSLRCNSFFFSADLPSTIGSVSLPVDDSGAHGKITHVISHRLSMFKKKFRPRTYCKFWIVACE